MSDCLTAALRYAKRGWRVFPLNGKVPYTADGFKNATTSAKKIRRWWERWPDANVGIACDSTYGPIVLDVDGPSGHELIELLEIDTATRTASSGKKKKLHLYFDPPEDSTPVPRKIKVRHNGKKYDLDILGDGGYVVAPPSIHPDTQRVYKWTAKGTLAPLPDEVLALLDDNGKKKAAPPLPTRIGQGERDNLLTSLAGTMRRRGASEDAIFASLQVMNETQVDPPLPNKDLRRIARSIGAKDTAVLEEKLTDLGNARRFITHHQHGVRAMLSSRRPWLVYDGKRWTPDTTGAVERMAKETVRSIYTEATHMGDEEQRDAILKHAHKSEAARSISAMMQLAATEPELSTTPDMLDPDPWLLNVNNGTIDLRTGKLRAHQREDLITRLVPLTYRKKARAPRWEQFLHEVFDGDAEVIEFVQRAIGYSLTGDTREHCLFFCYGQGANGKSTFLEMLGSMLGEYSVQADFSSFLSKNGDGPRNDIARMRGARLVRASEVDGEKGWDGKTVKLLTGDDTVVARRLYEEHFEFKPVHKLWLAANHKPIVKEQTVGFWRRIRLIPFTVSFVRKKRDSQLGHKLRYELPGILNWAIEGCLKWQVDGLIEPVAVKRATRDYREENDLLGEFFAQRCEMEPKAWTSTSVAYRAFVEWWMETRGTRSQPISIAWFARLLSERAELKPSKKNQTRGWRGISVTINNPML